MPFDTSTDPVNDYSVRIFFEGLMMLAPTSESSIKRCDVHVVNHHPAGHPTGHSADHELTVDVFVDEVPQPNFPIRRLGQKTLQGGLTIASTASTASQGVRAYNGGDVPGVFPISREIDFRRLHPTAHVKPANEHRAVIQIKDGVLHSALRRTGAVLSRNNQTTNVTFVDLALGIRVRSPLRLTWDDGHLDLPRTNAEPDAPDGPGAKYVILINHGRPVPTNINDFKHLYDALTGVAERDKFDLNFEENPVGATPRIPCIPGVTDG